MGWNLARRAAASEKARQTWREKHPERAAIRDELLSKVAKERCLCGSEDTRMFVTDYHECSYIWRCNTCSTAAREKFKAHRDTAKQ
jgi:hypothetical protein